jgi:hypothetical protein
MMVTLLANYPRSSDGDSASAPEISRFGRRTQWWRKVTDRVRTPCTEMSVRHPARGPTGGSVHRPRSVGQTSCQSSGPTGKSDRSDRTGRKFRVTFLVDHFRPPGRRSRVIRATKIPETVRPAGVAKCELSAERPYRGYSFGRLSAGHRWGQCERAAFCAIWSADPVVAKSHASRFGSVHQNVVPPSGARTHWWVGPGGSAADQLPSKNFRPTDQIDRVGQKRQEVPRDFFGPPFSHPPVGGVSRSGERKFWGRCARPK